MAGYKTPPGTIVNTIKSLLNNTFANLRGWIDVQTQNNQSKKLLPGFS